MAVGGVGDGRHTVGTRGGQQGVRDCVRNTGKALEGDYRRRSRPLIHYMRLGVVLSVLALLNIVNEHWV